MSKKLRPISINDIELDAFLSSDDQLQQDIPDYPTEDGFSASDTIILKPRVLNIMAYVGNIPATWKNRHGISNNRSNEVQLALEELYFAKELVTVKTADATYFNMGMVTLSISKVNSSYREISLSLKEVYVTGQKTAGIPNYSLKSGDTAANGGKASTSTGGGGGSGKSGGGSNGGNSGNSSGTINSKKAGSMLYGAASGLGFL